MTLTTDVAIIGGGPGGCTAAMFLAQQGIRTIIIEKDEFPRYHIGESMTGECGGILRRLGLGEKMIQAKHPQKQGVKVYGPSGHGHWYVPVMRRNEAGNLEAINTFSVRRSTFDRMMHDEAAARGAEMLRAEAIRPLWAADGRTMTGVRVRLPSGAEEDVRARVTLDITGQKTFFAHQHVCSEKVPGRYDKQVAVFSHVANPIRDDGSSRQNHPDNTLIFYKGKFHWSWFIPLDHETVSVGVVAPGAYFAAQKESKADYLRRELRELNPELARRVVDNTLTEEARAIPNYSYHSRTFTGPGWMCIGDTHRFIDPIFSFGLFVSMKEAEEAVPVIARFLGNEHVGPGNPFQAHMERLERGLDLTQDLIDGFWENPLGFAHLLHRGTHQDDITDLFAGRIYMEEPSGGVLALRKLAQAGLAKAG
jgi:flavin-dependent dehydrogenase